MITKNIEFTKVRPDRYISSAIEPNGDTGIELKFATNNNFVGLEQSITGEVWSLFKSEYYAGCAYQINVVGILSGQKIRVICSNLPVSAKYLQNE